MEIANSVRRLFECLPEVRNRALIGATNRTFAIQTLYSPPVCAFTSFDVRSSPGDRPRPGVVVDLLLMRELTTGERGATDVPSMGILGT